MDGRQGPMKEVGIPRGVIGVSAQRPVYGHMACYVHALQPLGGTSVSCQKQKGNEAPAWSGVLVGLLYGGGGGWKTWVGG